MNQPRAFASPTITFGRVLIPVKLYSAAQRDEGVRLSWLHKGCGEKLVQTLACPQHGPLNEEERAKGYEFSRGSFLELTDDEVAQLKGDEEPAITVLGTCALEQIPRVQLERAYYMAPDKGGDYGFALIRDALSRKKAVALVESVVRGSKSLAVIVPNEDVLVMHHLFYSAEVRTAPALEREVELGRAEMTLAQELVDELKMKKLELAAYVDEEKTRTLELLERRAHGERIVAMQREAPPAKIVNLKEALEQSLAANRRSKRKAG